jgi:hypothetical protein
VAALLVSNLLLDNLVPQLADRRIMETRVCSIQHTHNTLVTKWL